MTTDYLDVRAVNDRRKRLLSLLQQQVNPAAARVSPFFGGGIRDQFTLPAAAMPRLTRGLSIAAGDSSPGAGIPVGLPVRQLFLRRQSGAAPGVPGTPVVIPPPPPTPAPVMNTGPAGSFADIYAGLPPVTSGSIARALLTARTPSNTFQAV